MFLTTTIAPLLLLMLSTPDEEEAYIFEGDDPFAEGVKIYPYHGSLEDADPKQTIVCRNVMEVGSRLPRRICRVLREWQDIYGENQSDIANERRSKKRKG